MQVRETRVLCYKVQKINSGYLLRHNSRCKGLIAMNSGPYEIQHVISTPTGLCEKRCMLFLATVFPGITSTLLFWPLTLRCRPFTSLPRLHKTLMSHAGCRVLILTEGVSMSPESFSISFCTAEPEKFSNISSSFLLSLGYCFLSDQ